MAGSGVLSDKNKLISSPLLSTVASAAYPCVDTCVGND